jgi:HAD superfamily hydrolase (TIGR01549 family)
MGAVVPIFDLDGTLIDSDAALVAPFVALGVPEDTVTFGHVLQDECDRLGIALDDYLSHYDDALAQPYPGVADLVGSLRRWAVCSNKHPDAGHAELARLGWQPEVALFADSFEGSKTLPPVLEALGVDAGDVVFIGDTEHDHRCAAEVGCRFVVAGWNPRASTLSGDVVAGSPLDLLDLLGLGR